MVELACVALPAHHLRAAADRAHHVGNRRYIETGNNEIAKTAKRRYKVITTKYNCYGNQSVWILLAGHMDSC